jgi:carbon monoxide dehydrogenase subunit G
MSRYSFTHSVPVPPEQAWAVVSDHEGMASWLPPVRTVVLETAGSPDRNGVGAVRALHAVGPAIRERITAFEPGQRLAYAAVSGVPARDYTGEILLRASGSGTVLTWTIEFRPLFPGAQLVLAGAIGGAARLLARRLSR